MSTERKKSENTRMAYRGSTCAPNFFYFLTAESNSGASGEVNYRYLMFISFTFVLTLFYILILNYCRIKFQTTPNRTYNTYFYMQYIHVHTVYTTVYIIQLLQTSLVTTI